MTTNDGPALLATMLVFALACDGAAEAPNGSVPAAPVPPASGGAGPAPQAGVGGGTPAAQPTAGSGAGATAAGGREPPATGGVAAQPLPDAGVSDAGTRASDAADGSAVGDGCDRNCLLAMMQAYIDALLSQDASTLSVSADLRYTENGVASELGQSVWQTATALVPDARLDFADPQHGQVASQFAFEETGGTPVIYQVRLKVEHGEITEIESMAVRRRGAANGFFNVDNMVPEAVFLQPVSQDSRMTREQLLEITDYYLDYLEGSRNGREVPFDADCKRYENGQATASGISSFEAQSFWRFDVTRRVLVVDEEAGITWGMFPFSQADTALVVGEAFKILDGKIMMIQAVMANQPAKAWD